MIWLFYFTLTSDTIKTHITLSGSVVLILISCITGLWLTYTKYYRMYSYAISLTVAATISITSLLFFSLSFNKFSALGHFSMCVEVIFIIYTVIPLPLWQCSFITIIYSIIFEILTHFMGNYSAIQNEEEISSINLKLLLIRISLHICVHLIGVHILIMNVVRMRGTFMKVGQNLLVRRQLEMEKQLKEKMIHSVMPPKVANMLLKESGATMANDVTKRPSNDLNLKSHSNDVKSLFRPFHMHSMNNVSILFADIVGFTKMSSSKPAEELVEILNDLFERFDDLCVLKGCEKISTLGDCYYCVSGCPEPRPDHAICCVEMGLGMIEKMQTFENNRKAGVKIRIGIHTGTVLCGIVGTRRVKFDVWSNDVTFANRMESTGQPDQVHISQETSNFLSDIYELKEGDEVFGHRTYFVTGKREDKDHKNSSLCVQETSTSEKLSQSTLMLPELAVPPTSPVGHLNTVSAGPSPILSSRPRLASLGKVSKFLSSKKSSESKINTVQKPQIIVTAKSLPGSLNEDNTDDILNNKPNKIDNEKTSSFWKVPKFLRRIDEPCDEKLTNCKTDIESNGYCQLPMVVETNQLGNSNTLTVPSQISIALSMSPSSNQSNQYQNYHYDGGGCGALSPSGPFSIFDDIIDVRSYISQSRSDISPFARSGSYRSHCGRSPVSQEDAYGGCSGGGSKRPRSSTITSQYLTVDNANDNQRSLLEAMGSVMGGSDGISISPSIASRKDSGELFFILF